MTERRCHRDGCTSAARWRAYLHVDCPAPGGEKRALVLESTVEVCDEHQDVVRAYLLSDSNKEVIRTSLMEEGGYAEPDFLTARVEFKPVHRQPVRVRSIHQCDRQGCSSLATWQIRQVFNQTGPHLRMSCLTNYFVCEVHKRRTRPKHLLDYRNRAATVAMLGRNGIFAHGDVLDRMTLEFAPLQEVTLGGS